MALKKMLELPNGISGEYWKVISAYYEDTGHSTSGNCELALWKDQETRDINGGLGISKKFFKSSSPQVNWQDMTLSELELEEGQDLTIGKIIARAVYLKVKEMVQLEMEKPEAERNQDLIAFADAEDLI